MVGAPGNRIAVAEVRLALLAMEGMRLESQLVRERRGAERKREALREEVAELRAALVVARDAVAAGAA